MSLIQIGIRKTTVATAMGALVVTAANAESNVTLYGVLDASILYTSRSLDPSTGKNAGKTFAFADAGNTASRIGLKGSEDLGGGLRALFALESGIDTGNGGYNISNGNFFGRQAWVGLESPYGTTKVGLQFSPFLIAAEHLDPRGAALFGGYAVNYVGSVLGSGIFTPNAISYTSPQIAGLQGRVLLGLGNSSESFSAGRIYSAGVDYQVGGLFVDAAIYDSNGGSAVTTPIPTTLQFLGRIIGAGYNFGRVTVKASVTNLKIADAVNNYIYSGGVAIYPSPTVTLAAGVQYTTDKNHTANHSILSSAGFQYALSKRTFAYTQIAVVNNHGAANTGIAISGALHEPAGTTFGVDIGIRHMF
ncbi:porin [Burkholderia cepacia]|uniref:porin n=1 Tax=Burkholderia cepacia TaxID=292 RepID=UPI001CF42502|nr:porin [Burkholderia cepacia]MCA8348479.1 porin [Burkholderia cepacia]